MITDFVFAEKMPDAVQQVFTIPDFNKTLEHCMEQARPKYAGDYAVMVVQHPLVKTEFAMCAAPRNEVLGMLEKIYGVPASNTDIEDRLSRPADDNGTWLVGALADVGYFCIRMPSLPQGNAPGGSA